MLAGCIRQPYNKIRFINALPCQAEGPCGIQNFSGVPFSNCRLPFPASVFFCARPTHDALGGFFIARNRLHCEHFSNSDKFTIGRRGPLALMVGDAMVKTTTTSAAAANFFALLHFWQPQDFACRVRTAQDDFQHPRFSCIRRSAG